MIVHQLMEKLESNNTYKTKIPLNTAYYAL